MGVFAFLSYSSRPVEVDDVKPSEIPVVAVVDDEKNSVAAEPVLETVPAPIPTIVVSKPSRILKPPSVASFSSLSSSSRRFSLPAMPFTRHVASDPKPVLSTVHEHAKISSAASSFFKRAIRLSNSDKRAKKSALVVRALIIGPSASSFSSSRSTPAAPKLTLTSANARPQLNKLKSQLLEPKSANKVIAHLRALPVEDDHGARAPRGPIHAVCLEHADADEERLHFATLTVTSTADTSTARTKTNQTDMTVQASFFDAPLALDTVTDMFSKMNVVSLISAPGLGLGSSGDAEGLLAGAVPTAKTVLKGFEQITPQLMALGYATGKSVWVDHTGVYPPTDRMSILTYWWGLEIVLPPPSLKNLAKADSVAGTVVNFLTALSLINNGVREIMPFVRYIAQFIDFEFNNIQSQDKGMGVVCASTWIMPAALVPRPWDFAPLPASSPATPPAPTSTSEVTGIEPALREPSVLLPVLSSTSPSSTSPPNPNSPSSPIPNSKPVPIQSTMTITPVTPAETPASLPTFADSIVGAYANSVTFHPVAAPLVTTKSEGNGRGVGDVN